MRNFIKLEFECLCNLDCKYCFAGQYKFKVDEQRTIRLMESVFDKFDPKETMFRIEGIGEVTLYPEIISYLTKKVETGYSIEVLTNGIISQKFIKDNPLLKWLISLDGHTTQMNKYRGLSEVQVQRILDTIIEFNTEIQCVYSDQSIEEINEFIQYLSSKNYKGFLHISPRRYDNIPLNIYIDSEKLHRTDFIAPEEYFRRWKYIYDNKNRDFICSFYANGFVYRIMHDEDEVRKIKCDCANHEFIYDNEKCSKSSEANCDTCINQFEYDVNRKLCKQNIL